MRFSHMCVHRVCNRRRRRPVNFVICPPIFHFSIQMLLLPFFLFLFLLLFYFLLNTDYYWFDLIHLPFSWF